MLFFVLSLIPLMVTLLVMAVCGFAMSLVAIIEIDLIKGREMNVIDAVPVEEDDELKAMLAILMAAILEQNGALAADQVEEEGECDE